MKNKNTILEEIKEGMSDGTPFHKLEELFIEMYSLGKEETLNKLNEEIKSKYDKKDHGFEYWLTGNYDDTFEMGVKIGERDALYNISKRMGIDLEEPEQTEF